MIAWFTKNHVAANLLMVTIVFIGITSLTTRIPLEVFPTVELDTVSINANLPGSTPSETEQGLSLIHI